MPWSTSDTAHPLAGRRVGMGSTAQRGLSAGGVEVVEKLEVAGCGHHVEQDRSTYVAFTVERREQLAVVGPVVRRGGISPEVVELGSDAGAEHVDVAYLAEQASDPRELGAQVTHPLLVEKRRQRVQIG